MSSRKPRAVVTRDAVLDAAWDLVSQRGAEVSMAEIARVAGVSRQAVYLHFGTRGGMLMALVKRADDRFRIREDFEEALEVPEPADRLDRSLAIWFAFVSRIFPVARDLVRLRSTDPEAAAAWDDRMAVLRGWLRTLVETLFSDGALSPEWTVSDATDYLWAASSVPAWGLLVTERGWSEAQTGDVLRRTIGKALLR